MVTNPKTRTADQYEITDQYMPGPTGETPTIVVNPGQTPAWTPPPTTTKPTTTNKTYVWKASSVQGEIGVRGQQTDAPSRGIVTDVFTGESFVYDPQKRKLMPILTLAQGGGEITDRYMPGPYGGTPSILANPALRDVSYEVTANYLNRGSVKRRVTFATLREAVAAISGHPAEVSVVLMSNALRRVTVID